MSSSALGSPGDAFPVQCLSVSHRTASEEAREPLAFATEALPAALRSARATAGIGRLVIVSTCHRVELYGDLPQGPGEARDRLIAWLAAVRGVDESAVSDGAIYLQGETAARHLCRVAAGLDAALLGEAEILTQVSGAIRMAVAEHAATPALKTLFRCAVRVGERARGRVWSRYRRTDVGSVAADAAAAALGGLARKRVTVFGAGRVGRLAARSLAARGAALTILNRTAERAKDVAERHDASWGALDESAIGASVRQADAIIVATGATEPVLTAREVASAARTSDRPLVVVDTAMPRNVDPAVGDLPGVRLIDLNALHEMMAAARHERAQAVPHVEALIDAELATVLDRRWAAWTQVPGGPSGGGAGRPSPYQCAANA